ncbi:unnamed protein product [Symbiodinium necroappetens]|uniref:Uncharacterized protein n=1 Tax=Symbiodinium necroappetens TaxID=1628268 RepID=A0A812U6B7_9DINO|nr:unnamed protein product [Symbiodinium necroappetens]
MICTVSCSVGVNIKSNMILFLWPLCQPSNSQYCRCALGYHSVLATGLMHLHGITREKPTVLNDDADDTMLATSEFIESEGSVELYRKTLRIKAKKSLDWVRDTTSCYKLLLSALVVSPLERIMYTFMQWQHTQAFLSKASPPAVVMANPTRSPACAAMRQLCGQMRSGKLIPDVADSTTLVDLARGLPATTPDDFIRRGFWCFVRGVGEVWHRLYLPYMQLPWLLARLLDSTIDASLLNELASWFMKLPDCCLNGWFGHAIRARVSDETDLLPGGKCQMLLRGLYNCKTFNIEVENNFARMQSMKRVGRGRLDLAHNLASKHVLAEAKLAHVRELTRCDAPDPGPQQPKIKTYNGYTLFWSEEMQKRVCRPGETSEQCRRRTMNECKHRWSANQNLRETYSFQAKIKNQQARKTVNNELVAAQNGPHEVGETDNDNDGPMDSEVAQLPQDRTGGELVPHNKINMEYVQPLALGEGYGCFGMGDRRFGINKKLVQDADDAEKGFVQKQSREWRAYAGGVCGEKTCFSGSVYPGCLDIYGFCCKTIMSRSLYEMVLDQLQAMVRNHRRRHVSVRGKKTTNSGPDSSIDHPFLVAWNAAESWSCRDAPQGWLMNWAQFSPYDANWWQWSVKAEQGVWKAEPMLVHGGLDSGLPSMITQEQMALNMSNKCVVGFGEICLDIPHEDDASWMKVGSDQLIDGEEAEEEATDQTVWVQGGYEAEYVSEAKYQAAVQHDPTINHGFLSLRSHVIRMKQEDPNCKFRLERVAPAIKEKVRASQSRQQGLEKPETHFVLLSVYTEEYGKPDPSQIVYEVIDGVSVPGVDVLTGRAGWHKRVNRDMCDVTKTAELTDINIDPTGQAADRMFQASKKQLTKAYVQPSRKALLHPPSASSACAQEEVAKADTGVDEVTSGKDGADIDASDSDDDAAVPSMIAMLKSRYSGNSAADSKGKSVKPQAAPKPKAATSRNKTAEDNAPVGISNANRKRRRADVQAKDEGAAQPHETGDEPPKKKVMQACGDVEDDDDGTGAIASSDQEVIDQFESKIASLKEIDPPNDDANFKEYMDNHLQKVNATITELRTKKKSVGRRKHQQGEMLLSALASVETSLKAIVMLNKRITGATPVASTSSLLDVLREAEQDGFQFGSTVTRRALKALVADDIKVGRWTALVTSTREVICQVLQTADDVDSDEFFYMSCSQAMAKLVKGTMGKIKNKDLITNQQPDNNSTPPTSCNSSNQQHLCSVV